MNLAEAKAPLSAWVARAEAGETVSITRRGKRVARLIAAERPTASERPLETVDTAMLEALTDKTPPQSESAGQFIRKMRDPDRYWSATWILRS